MKKIHFIGICGTAMAAVASAMKDLGYDISGSDEKVYPPMSTFLESRGIQIHEGYNEDNLNPHPDLVVVGNALSRGNPEIESLLNQKLRYCSLPELLKEHVIQGKRSIVITGTHGKTTVTSLMTWVFETAGLNPGFVIGGIPENFGRGARFTDSPWFIIEGDEYDSAFFDKRSKFVHYLPEIAVINNLEFDHADIFPDLAAIQLMFKRFINLIPGKGLLLANGDEPHLRDLLDGPHFPIQRFGLSAGNALDSKAESVEYKDCQSVFKVGETTFTIPLTGELNVRNALAVITCARHCGVTDQVIQNAFNTFKGIKRRMEIRGEENGVMVIDDFGHHPTAIRETLKALKIRFPSRRLWAVFEPRSNTTRRHIFQKELVEAFHDAEIVSISPIARLKLLEASERLNPEKLISDLQKEGKSAACYPSVNAIVDSITEKSQPGDLICVFSNGGFENIHNRLLEALKLKNPSE